ncbi:Type I phosphodiesterase / nucleotide pyrophosphatase [uncultured archaeon]|nr:Type I phosphodiesterase / nucleotide pyrophosphatase [uncultured archaeon]
MKTLILFIDAFSFTDLKKENCPFMYQLAKDGAYGPLKTIPAGYHIEYSMVSGCLPLKHNVWAWYYMNPKGSFSKIKYVRPFLNLLERLNLKKIERTFIDFYINFVRLLEGKTRFLKSNKIPLDILQKFDISVDKMHFEHNPLPVPTMFDIFRQENIKYVGMEFPIISDNKKTGFYFTKGDFKELKIAEKKLKIYDIVYLHIWSLDALEHKYGLHSKEALNYLGEVDKHIQEIVKRNKDLRVVIFSDHGGVNVTKTKNILPIIEKYDCDYFLGSTSAQVWFKNPDAKKKAELKEILKKEGYIIYDETNIEKELFIPYKREFVGDLMADVKPGEQIYPDFFRDTAKVESMHGYSEKVPELSGVFIMNNFGIKNKQIEGMKLYDIAPTVLSGMKIKTPKIWDGKAKV